jgi:hypothetical protein
MCRHLRPVSRSHQTKLQPIRSDTETHLSVSQKTSIHEPDGFPFQHGMPSFSQSCRLILVQFPETLVPGLFEWEPVSEYREPVPQAVREAELVVNPH